VLLFRKDEPETRSQLISRTLHKTSWPLDYEHPLGLGGQQGFPEALTQQVIIWILIWLYFAQQEWVSWQETSTFLCVVRCVKWFRSVACYKK
jgi:hypothetical protein